MSGRLHLKSFMSMLDNDVILISSSPGAKSIREEMESKSSHFSSYKFVEVSSDHAANVLCFNGTVIAPAGHRDRFKNVSELRANSSNVKWTLDGEFEKIDGLLSCRSILFDDGNK